MVFKNPLSRELSYHHKEILSFYLAGIHLLPCMYSRRLRELKKVIPYKNSVPTNIMISKSTAINGKEETGLNEDTCALYSLRSPWSISLPFSEWMEPASTPSFTLMYLTNDLMLRGAFNSILSFTISSFSCTITFHYYDYDYYDYHHHHHHHPSRRTRARFFPAMWHRILLFLCFYLMMNVVPHNGARLLFWTRKYNNINFAYKKERKLILQVPTPTGRENHQDI